jgi:hypothetical protein
VAVAAGSRYSARVRWTPTLVIMLACGCGARSGLDRGAPPDGGVVLADAGPPPRSCWSEPNCIEADFTVSDARYRESGAISPTSRAFYFDGAAAGSLTVSIKLMRDAAPGVEPYDADDGNVFVTVRAGAEDCVLFADVVLTRVDVSPGGVTEGTFAGRLVTCPSLGDLREGRFRLTAP